MRSTAITKKQVTGACLCIFAIGTLARIVLDRYWHAVSPRVNDLVGGHTFALSGRGGTVFVTQPQRYLLECLEIFPWVFLLIGLLVWARAWREWK